MVGETLRDLFRGRDAATDSSVPAGLGLGLLFCGNGVGGWGGVELRASVDSGLVF